jgi:AcrR family transcriptional regulator
MAKPSIRKDALRSRHAILDAARELFAADREASFTEIAHAAGVGQATVYRHFEDRQDLLEALGWESIGKLEKQVAEEPVSADSFERLLRLATAELVSGQALAAAIRRGQAGEDPAGGIAERVRALFREPLAAAQEAGLLRRELDLDDVMAVLTMLDGALAAASDRRRRQRAAARALELVLDGLRP